MEKDKEQKRKLEERKLREEDMAMIKAQIKRQEDRKKRIVLEKEAKLK